MKLDNVNASKYFYLNSGETIKSVTELAKKLGKMSDSDFHHHVTSHRNDFSSWVEHVVESKELADTIKHMNNKQDMARTVSAFISKNETRTEKPKVSNSAALQRMMDKDSNIDSKSITRKKPITKSQTPKIKKAASAETKVSKAKPTVKKAEKPAVKKAEAKIEKKVSAAKPKVAKPKKAPVVKAKPKVKKAEPEVSVKDETPKNVDQLIKESLSELGIIPELDERLGNLISEIDSLKQNVGMNHSIDKAKYSNISLEDFKLPQMDGGCELCGAQSCDCKDRFEQIAFSDKEMTNKADKGGFFSFLKIF